MRVVNYFLYRMEVAVNCKEIEVAVELNVSYVEYETGNMYVDNVFIWKYAHIWFTVKSFLCLNWALTITKFNSTM